MWDGLLQVIAKVIDVYGLEKARAPYERVRKLRHEILEERSLGDMADQVKISNLKKQLEIDGESLKDMMLTGLEPKK